MNASDDLDRMIEEWAAAIDQLHANSVDEPGDLLVAEHELALAWSAWGYQPRIDVWRMLSKATQVGYLLALKDLREGKLHDQIRAAHPDLARET